VYFFSLPKISLLRLSFSRVHSDSRIGASTLNWDTCSIDFSNAFVQAKLQEPVWIHLPRGFHSGNVNTPKRCLRLNKSLYGLSIAPRLWFDHVLKAFTSQGFKQSQNDPCFLYKSTIMVVLYVDDVGIAYSDPKDLDTLLKNLTEKDLHSQKMEHLQTSLELSS
jgi:Reverse transcriptase (RNA-dependent DNA polymerase)